MGYKRITCQEAAYLKAMGEANNVKVTIKKTADGEIRIYMRDYEFKSLRAALEYLQEDSRHIQTDEEA